MLRRENRFLSTFRQTSSPCREAQRICRAMSRSCHGNSRSEDRFCLSVDEVFNIDGHGRRIRVDPCHMKASSETLISSMTAIEPRPVVERSDLRSDLERLHAESWGWALACCGHDRELAQDVLQTAYLTMLSGKARFDGRSNLKTWVFGVIRVTARTETRRGWLWRIRHRGPENALGVPDPATSADADPDAVERSAALIRALATLSQRQREVIQLAFYHDLTIEEAARVMNVSVGSARTHYDRGKKMLARRLAEWRTP